MIIRWVGKNPLYQTTLIFKGTDLGLTNYVLNSVEAEVSAKPDAYSQQFTSVLKLAFDIDGVLTNAPGSNFVKGMSLQSSADLGFDIDFDTNFIDDISQLFMI